MDKMIPENQKGRVRELYKECCNLHPPMDTLSAEYRVMPDIDLHYGLPFTKDDLLSWGRRTQVLTDREGTEKLSYLVGKLVDRLEANTRVEDLRVSCRWPLSSTYVGVIALYSNRTVGDTTLKEEDVSRIQEIKEEIYGNLNDAPNTKLQWWWSTSTSRRFIKSVHIAEFAVGVGLSE
ncbi:hypothetical protein OF83DRAFT_1082545 [Amylostereum chailletii]|nr:hypothetical protein OF83DRAFT_1082545 [Amylostereum chailletii]